VANFKWGLIAGVFALFVSLVLGVFSGVAAFHILIRTLIFTVLFFGIGFGLRFMITGFFPELLLSAEETAHQETEHAGAQVNIILDSMGEYAVPELFNAQGDSEELGNIEDLISGVYISERPQKANTGIDRNKEASYNDFEVLQPDGDDADSGGFSDFNEEAVFKPTEPQSYQSFTPSFGDEMGLGGLPDLDVMARAFSAPSSAAPSGGGLQEMEPVQEMQDMTDSPVFAAEEPARKTGSKAQPIQGDWDAKGLAEGIRTVLSKER